MYEKDYVGINKGWRTENMIHVTKNPDFGINFWVCPSCQTVAKIDMKTCPNCICMIPNIPALKNNHELRLTWHFLNK
jgi:hypothetical protein